MRLLIVIWAYIGINTHLIADPSNQIVSTPKEDLLRWIEDHQIPKELDVANINTQVPKRYIVGHPETMRNFSAFMEWMGFKKEKARISYGVNLGLFRSLDITDEYILILFMHDGGSADDSFIIRGLVIRQVDDMKLSKILRELMNNPTKWRTAIPKEGEQVVPPNGS